MNLATEMSALLAGPPEGGSTAARADEILARLGSVRSETAPGG